MKSEKANALNIGSNKKLNKTITMHNHTPKQFTFQYTCSFCQCELPDGGVCFNGIGACPACNDLAHRWIKSLWEHWVNYYLNLGVRR